MSKQKSNLGKLNWQDGAKGLAMAVIAAVVTVLYEAVNLSGDLSSVNWKTVISVGFIAAVSYLFKNLGTNSDDKILKKEK